MTMRAADNPDTAVVRGHQIPVGLYLGGRWTTVTSTFPVYNPSTEECLAEVAAGTPEDACTALDAAVAAQQEWRAWSPRRRADLFHTAYRLLIDRADAFADVMTSESGKPHAEARAEFGLSAGFWLWYAEQIAHLHGTFAHGSPGGYRVITAHEPVGPCLLITPWNFPLLMSARKAGAALGAGCPVVIKSAQETPLTAALFVQTLHEAGFPPGVVNLIHTRSSASVAEALMADFRLRKISFTGSTAVGATLLAKAAPNIVNASMELGGDGPFVVLSDADVDLAVEQAVICKFRNAGQACVAANRIILHAAIAEEFTAKFLDRVNALRVGDGFTPGVEVGPMINARQRERVVGLIEAFVAAGAELLAGGRPVDGNGYFFQPTVLRVKDRAADLCNEELFAPVAALYTVDSVAEAVEFANDTTYGLAAYVFSRDLSRAVAVAERLQFGMVGVNRGIMADPAASFGGTKASGIGREGGHDGIYEFLEPKYIALTIDEDGALSS